VCWAFWANYLSVQLSPNILLETQSKYWLKNGHVQIQTTVFKKGMDEFAERDKQ
jgi:hypothetical protein